MTGYYLNVKFSCLLAPSTVDWKTKTKPMLLPYIGNPTDLHILSTFQPKKYLLQVEANKLKVFRIRFHFFISFVHALYRGSSLAQGITTNCAPPPAVKKAKVIVSFVCIYI